MSKKVLVIGGNGYIGSRLIHDIQSKYVVHSIDLNWFSEKNINNQIKDYNSLTKQELAEYDVIILLAGHSSVKMCAGPIFASWNNNVNNFIQLINKLDKNQLIVYASSGSIYGQTTVSSTEDMPTTFKPINHYDLTKYAVDMHAEKFIKEGYTIVGLRFGTVNGWSPNIREELMINSMTKKSIFEKALTINNKKIKRPILGLADITNAIETIIASPISGIYNLASFTDTVEHISTIVSQTFNSALIDTSDFKDVYDFDMSTTKFKNTFNFSFNETVESIIKELSTHIDQCNFTNRNKFIDYE